MPPGKHIPTTKRQYHHGDLKSALLQAAESVLEDKGVAGFTLRECARRAGVSHAAPAHHFRDVQHLLTVMATVAFERLNTSMRERREQAGNDPKAALQAIGEGYIAFASNNPQHFALMFRPQLLDRDDPAFKKEAQSAFTALATALSALHGGKAPLTHTAGRTDLILFWSVVHGFSQLYLEGKFRPDTPGLGADMQLETLARQMLQRLLELFPSTPA